MQPRVTAVLVARNGERYLPRTIAAIAAQTRRPESVIQIDAGSTDASPRLLAETPGAQLATLPGKRSFGAAVGRAVQSAPPQGDNEWLWLLGHDNAPEPTALARLLGAVEVAPSVAVAGPKLMRWDEPGIIASFGQTVTSLGRSVQFVTDELDQAQYDTQSDFLGVAAAGMLVRRSVFTQLGGFDPGLPSVDAALDLSVRARLAGHRVIGVPGARVASAGPPELFGRRTLSVGARNRITRSAQLHRRMVYAPAAALPVHWLSLVPLAMLRSIGHLLAKRPGSVGGELAAAFAVSFDTAVLSARRRLGRARHLRFSAIAPLRMRFSELRQLRAGERLDALDSTIVTRRPGFFAAGGAWMVLLTGLIGAITFGSLTGARAVTGGALVPLSATVTDLWSNVGYGWRDIGTGFIGAADPFAYVLAVLGSLTFWSPSTSIVLLYLTALPLAALGAWFCAARFSQRAWAPAVAAVAWALAPPFLASLAGGHLGAVIAHLLLPPLVIAVVGAARTWSMAALAALLFAAVVAGAPVLAPALLLCLVGWMAMRPASILRLLIVPLPAAALFAPLVVQQAERGTVIAVFAEPGVPVGGAAASGAQLLVGAPGGALSGWGPFLASLGLDAALAPLVVVVLLAPLAALALLALFLPGARRSVPSLAIAVVGLATAIAAAHIEVVGDGASTIAIWPAAALGLYWLGLIAAATGALEALGRAAPVPALAVAVAAVLMAIPLLTVVAAGTAPVVAGTGRLLPALVSAQAATQPELGTLELAAGADGSLAAAVHRGTGTTLDERSTLHSTRTTLVQADTELMLLAGNLASRSGLDLAAALDELQIGFVLVPGAAADATAVRQRIVEALDGNRLLVPVGETDYGYLWRYPGLAAGAAPVGPSPTATPLGFAVLLGQGIVFGLILLLAVPTSRRKRLRASETPGGGRNDTTA